MFASFGSFIGDPHPHSGGDPLEDGIDIFQDVRGLDPHHTDTDGLQTFVTTLGERFVCPLFVDHDRHAEIVAIEVDNRAADDSLALESVAAEIGISEALGEHLVRF